MKKLLLTSLLIATMPICHANSYPVSLNNPLVAEAFSALNTNYDSEPDSWDIAAMRSVLRDSNLYKLLMMMTITVPSTAKTSEYVLLYNEVHQVNQNLALILQELQKMNAKL